MKKQLKMLFRIRCVNGEDDIQEQGMAEDFVSGLWRIIRNLMGGHGSAMRVSAAGWLYPDLEQTRAVARATAKVTHNHPEGIKGAEATASCIFLARNGKSKEEIREYVTGEFHYNLNRTLDEIRPFYHHVESCQETVPEAIIAFLEAGEGMVKELEDFDYERFCKEHRQEVCHGDCNQHNIIFTREGIGFMNFDYWHCGPQTEDLCLFMRKILGS